MKLDHGICGGGMGGAGGGSCNGGIYGWPTPELICVHPLMVKSAIACGPTGAQIPYISMGFSGGSGGGMNRAFRYESQGPSEGKRSPNKKVLLAPPLTSANPAVRWAADGCAMVPTI